MTPERVADYPRPPRLEPSVDHVLVQVGDEVLFDREGGDGDENGHRYRAPPMNRSTRKAQYAE